MLVVLKRRSGRREVSDFDEIRQDSKHLGEEPTYGRTILMTTNSPFLGISPLTCRDGVATVSVMTGSKLSSSKLPNEILGWYDEGDVAVKRLPLVLQLKLTPTRV
jgi:hypothetical protein